MAGRIPKPPGQKRNRVKPPLPPQKLGPGEKPVGVPPLPGTESLSQFTRDWWQVIWEAPMSAMWLLADVPALVRCAYLVELNMSGEATPSDRAEIRQIEDRFGLSPLARRRLQWEIEQAGGSVEPAASADGEGGRFLRAVSD